MDQEMVVSLCKGNPGALNVCFQLYQLGGNEILTQLKDQGIQGSNIWLLYKDECGENIETTKAIIEAGNAYATLKGNRYFKE